MSAQTGKTNVDIGAAIKAHAKDETDYGMDFSQLPGGIYGGIAILSDAKMGVYKSGRNVGKKFIYLQGTVEHPKSAARITKVLKNGKVEVVSTVEEDIEGKFTKLTLPWCESKNSKGETTSLDVNVKNALNVLRTLGGDECTADLESEADVEGLLKALVEQSPRFKFNTETRDPTAQYPNPMTFERWLGRKGLEDYVPSENGSVAGTMDNTGADKAAPAAVGEGRTDELDNKTLDELVEIAKGDEDDATEGDSVKAARQKILDIAKELGVFEAANDASDWDEAKGVIEAAQNSDPSVLEAPKVWKVKDMCYFRILDGKTGKPKKDGKGRAIKPVECQISAKNKNGTYNLKNQDDGKTVYSNVKEDQLLESAD